MRSLLLDTNLLCLLVVGQLGETRIAEHKRLDQYDVGEYRRLTSILARFDRLIVTSHILTECSNLVRLARTPLKDQATDQLAIIIRLAHEHRPVAIETIEVGEFRTLGLTDASILELIVEGTVLLTDDLDLYLAAIRRGVNAVNYNHLREGALLDQLAF